MANPTSIAEGSGLKLPLLVGDDGTPYIPAAGTAETMSGGWTSQRAPALVELVAAQVAPLADVITSFSALAIDSEATVWTPASGKKWRLLGFVITSSGAAGDITLKDDTGGTTVLTIPETPTGQPLSVMLGAGLTSSSADYVLTATGTTSQTISGFLLGQEI